jgi:hypothetical protein
MQRGALRHDRITFAWHPGDVPCGIIADIVNDLWIACNGFYPKNGSSNQESAKHSKHERLTRETVLTRPVSTLVPPNLWHFVSFGYFVVTTALSRISWAGSGGRGGLANAKCLPCRKCHFPLTTPSQNAQHILPQYLTKNDYS